MLILPESRIDIILLGSSSREGSACIDRVINSTVEENGTAGNSQAHDCRVLYRLGKDGTDIAYKFAWKLARWW